MTSSEYYDKAHALIEDGHLQKATEVAESAISKLSRRGMVPELSEAYHLMGEIFYAQLNFELARSWYEKALSIDKKFQAEGVNYARTCNNLGVVEKALGNLEKAESWFLESLRIKDQVGDKQGLATCYHQLGTVAERRDAAAAAEGWYLESLAIEEELGNAEGTVQTLLSLHMLEQQRGDQQAAELWFDKASVTMLAIGTPTLAIKTGRMLASLDQFGLAARCFHVATEAANSNRESKLLSECFLNLAEESSGCGEYGPVFDSYEGAIAFDIKSGSSRQAARTSWKLAVLYLTHGDGKPNRLRSSVYWLFRSLQILIAGSATKGAYQGTEAVSQKPPSEPE